ncbi:MAG: hypothetical protein Q8O41_00795 [Candidatus Methanoperedens sp.]|nr:hypothetical protein [Candidatus Methanoperedens sp.]
MSKKAIVSPKLRLRKRIVELQRPGLIRAMKIDKTDGLIRRRPRDPEKIKIFCKLAADAVKEGVVFKGKKIMEILPWKD